MTAIVTKRTTYALTALLLLIALYRVASVRAELPAIDRVAPLQSSALAVDANKTLGKAEAQVLVQVFSDYECPACKSTHQQMKRLLADYPRDVAVTYRHLPITSVHRHALRAALAAECAAAQGRFEHMHDLLFASQGAMDRLVLIDAAYTAGIQDRDEFLDCMESTAARDAVERDVATARDLGISGTPAFVFNDLLVDDNVAYRAIKAIVRQALKEKTQ